MSKVYLYSDPHFWHTNIIKFCRPEFLYNELAHIKQTGATWEDLNKEAKEKITGEMSEYLMDKYNSVVNDMDLVIILGDFCFADKATSAAMVGNLNGQKILVRGNHDRSVSAMNSMGFSVVVDSLVYNHKGIKVQCQHRPLYTPLSNLGVDLVAHGHIHRATKFDLERAGEIPKIPYFNINCCVEVCKWKPISIEEVIGRFKQQKKAIENGHYFLNIAP